MMIASLGAKIGPAEPPVPLHPAEELLKRAVASATSRNKRKGEKHPRWVAVMDAFALGRTYAHQLCVWAGLNPDDEVAR